LIWVLMLVALTVITFCTAMLYMCHRHTQKRKIYNEHNNNISNAIQYGTKITDGRSFQETERLQSTEPELELAVVRDIDDSETRQSIIITVPYPHVIGDAETVDNDDNDDDRIHCPIENSPVTDSGDTPSTPLIVGSHELNHSAVKPSPVHTGDQSLDEGIDDSDYELDLQVLDPAIGGYANSASPRTTNGFNASFLIESDWAEHIKPDFKTLEDEMVSHDEIGRRNWRRFTDDSCKVLQNHALFGNSGIEQRHLIALRLAVDERCGDRLQQRLMKCLRAEDSTEEMKTLYRWRMALEEAKCKFSALQSQLDSQSAIVFYGAIDQISLQHAVKQFLGEGH